MALINCPACNKRVSSRAPSCPSCNASIASVNDEATERAMARTRWKKTRQRQNISFLAILLFTVGVALFWYNREAPDGWEYILGVWLLALGFLGYGALRIHQIVNRNK